MDSSTINLQHFKKLSFSGDNRMFIGDLYQKFQDLVRAGWQKEKIYSQKLEILEDIKIDLPIFAYRNSDKPHWVVLAGIHGHEPAGSNALAHYVDCLIKISQKKSILIVPLCNPWGYVKNRRLGPLGKSVGEFHPRSLKPQTNEARRLSVFFPKYVEPGTLVLDLHEDPSFEDRKVHTDSYGTYIFVVGQGASNHPLTIALVKMLKENGQPLIMEGKTRLGEPIVNGVVADVQDGSVDQFLASLGATPVITPEIYLKTPTNPPLSQRIELYRKALDIFFK